MEAQREEEVVLEEGRQMHLDASSRNQQSPQLTEMGHSRDCGQTWSSLQRCVVMFPPGNGHMDTGCTLQGKSAIYTPQWEHG